MTNDDVIYRSRLRLFALAKEMGSVRAACRMLGVHHSTYYRWRRLLLRYGRKTAFWKHRLRLPATSVGIRSLAAPVGCGARK